MAASVMIAFVILIGMSYLNGRQIGATQETLNDRLDQIDGRLMKLSTKVDQVAAARAAAPRSGPDPDRVYAIKTDAAPVKGPPNAPVTIAEFSDFQ